MNNHVIWKIHIQNNDGWKGQNSHTGRVLSTAAVFPRLIATADPDSNLVCWPNSLKKVMASEPNTLDVSMAMGTK